MLGRDTGPLPEHWSVAAHSHAAPSRGSGMHQHPKTSSYDVFTQRLRGLIRNLRALNKPIPSYLNIITSRIIVYSVAFELIHYFTHFITRHQSKFSDIAPVSDVPDICAPHLIVDPTQFSSNSFIFWFLHGVLGFCALGTAGLLVTFSVLKFSSCVYPQYSEISIMVISKRILDRFIFFRQSSTLQVFLHCSFPYFFFARGFRRSRQEKLVRVT